ncbi:MAG: diaminopimelate epimerase [Fimbriimonadaceae bacterium]
MIPFVKMHGIGNDFVMLDLVDRAPPHNPAYLAQRMSDRRTGVGGDGLILVERGTSARFRMRMFNPDGSEAEMCGNGIRCFARLLRNRGYLAANETDIDTGAGRLVVQLTEDGQVRVDMGQARMLRGEIPMTGPEHERFVDEPVGLDNLRGTAVSMGNPHLVIFTEDVAAVPLERLGPALEINPLFPRRTNVHFAQVVSRTQLIQRTWERGAGITLACGTGACAVAVAGVLTDRSARSTSIALPGGRLGIEYVEDGRVFMTGPAVTVYEGSWQEDAAT